MDVRGILDVILIDYPLPVRGFHGVGHWARVWENGLRLAAETGADPEVVKLFALFHDSRRLNDGWDDGHGLRGAKLAKRCRGKLFDLSDDRFELLYRACAWHTEGRDDGDVTVLTCWDADRLDLGRVGEVPNPKYLCTAAGKASATIDWAHARAVKEFEPAIVIDEWGVPPREW